MTTVRSNNQVITTNGEDGFGDTVHHYDVDVLADLINTNISTAEGNTTAAGTQAVPQFFLTPTVVDNSDGTINVRVPYNGFYDPQPTSQRIDVYKADDASFTNETLVSQNSVPVGTASYTFTLPNEVDNKYYYGKFVGENANGQNEFITSNYFFFERLTGAFSSAFSGAFR